VDECKPLATDASNWYGAAVAATSGHGGTPAAPGPASPFPITELFDSMGPHGDGGHGAGSPSRGAAGSPLNALSTMLATGNSPLMGNSPGVNLYPGGSPMNLYHQLMSSPAKMRDAVGAYGGTPGASILRKNTRVGASAGKMAPPAPATGGGGGGVGGVIGGGGAPATGASGAEESPSMSGFGWFDTPGGIRTRRTPGDSTFPGTTDTARGGNATPASDLMSSRAAAVGATGRGLHSFKLELNLSNSRTHSWVKFGDTVDRRAQVQLNSEECKPLATGASAAAAAIAAAMRDRDDGLDASSDPHGVAGIAAAAAAAYNDKAGGRGLHSSTSQLNLSRF